MVTAHGGIEMDRIITYFLWFILYSFTGWLYETIICSIGQRRFINRGFLNGPYCPIYGTGALLMIFILGGLTDCGAGVLFVLGVIVACTLEYMTSYVMERLFHARWWDYSKRRLNINGRICLLGAVVFGVFSVLLILVLHPMACGWVDAIPILFKRILAALIFTGFSIDCILSVCGMISFQKKLEEYAATLEKRKAIAVEKLKDSTAYESIKKHKSILSENLSRQQRRMINAFPMLKLHRHNDLLIELRESVIRRHSQHRKNH